MKKIMFNDRYGLTQAVLDGRKTVTRRIIKAPKRINGQDTNGFIVCQDIATHEVTGIYARGYDGGSIEDAVILPKYEIGEVVTVAQSYKDAGVNPDYIVSYKKDDTPITAIQSPGWTNKMFIKPDIHEWNKDGNMFFCTYLIPHRIRITGIRIERLQDISDEDCLQEGIRYVQDLDLYYFERTDRDDGFYLNSPREAFAALIDRVSGRGTWGSNPYVVVYKFELVK